MTCSAGALAASPQPGRHPWTGGIKDAPGLEYAGSAHGLAVSRQVGISSPQTPRKSQKVSSSAHWPNQLSITVSLGQSPSSS
jgi:hypothetical protein